MSYTLSLKSKSVELHGTNLELEGSFLVEVDSEGVVDSITLEHETLGEISLDPDLYEGQLDRDELERELYEAQESMGEASAEADYDYKKQHGLL